MTTPSPLPTPSSSPTTTILLPPPPSVATPPPRPSSTPTPLSQPSPNPSDPPNASAQSPPLATPSIPPPTTPSSPPPQPTPRSLPPPHSPTLLAPHPLPQTSPPPVPYRPPPSTPPSGQPSGSPPPAPPLLSPPLPLAPSSQPPQISPPSTPLEQPGNSPPPSAPPQAPPFQSPPPPTPPSDPPAGSLPPPSSNPPLPPLRSPPPPPPTPSSPSERPENSPPPAPAVVPPTPASKPPTYSPPPPPGAITPSNAPPPPRQIPSQPAPQPTPPVPSTPPPSVILLAPPPPPPPLKVPGRRSNSPSVNNSNPNAPESSGSPNNNRLSTGALIGIGAALGIATLSFIVLLVWCLRRRKKQLSGVSKNYVMPSSMRSPPTTDSAFLKIPLSIPLYGNSSGSDAYPPSEPGGLGHSKELFPYEELVKATNDFATQNLLGEGGFGRVYEGLLTDGRKVAVKQLKMGGGQGDREFKAEVETISRIHHRYLVSLVGYCISENRRLLIYEYVPNNNLYFHLHAEGRPALDWGKRFKVAAGAARGITYLHEDCHPRIIHRDIKSSNILLDENFDARVSDFGLAKLAIDANTHITTRVMGTFGYMAPEYASSGKLTEKSDVFSFGVVLLELITGRMPVDTSQPLGDESLVEWARPLLSHAVEKEEFEAVADPRLGGNYVAAEMFRMIEAAAACVRHSAAKRPQMGQVLRAFDSLTDEDLTNGMKLGESEVFESAEQSAEIRLFQRMAFGSQSYSTDFFTHTSWKSREENV